MPRLEIFIVLGMVIGTLNVESLRLALNKNGIWSQSTLAIATFVLIIIYAIALVAESLIRKKWRYQTF